MALRRCCRLAAFLPRLPVLPSGFSSPVGRLTLSSFVSTPPSCRQAEVRLRGFSSEARNTDVSYGQLKQLLAEGRAVVVDVREPWELREYGFIPGSVNVPLRQVNTALQLAPEEFRERYDGEMPRRTDNIVFVCLAGVRSKTALNTAASLGYKDDRFVYVASGLVEHKRPPHFSDFYCTILVDGKTGRNVNSTSDPLVPGRKSRFQT